MSRWLAFIGVLLVLYAAMSLLLSDYLPVDLWDWFTELFSDKPSRYYKVVPGEAGPSMGWPALILGVVFIALAKIFRAKNRG